MSQCWQEESMGWGKGCLKDRKIVQNKETGDFMGANSSANAKQ